jgi:excinuclease ABC subunit B
MRIDKSERGMWPPRIDGIERGAARFQLVSPYRPMGDQPTAIAALTKGLDEGKAHQTLLGVTGSGKTFSIANVIAHWNRPTLVLAHNKILAAQLYSEFRELFPHNAVEYFVSYYDYFQPEAYVPRTDTFIEKESMINQRIERLRNAATASLLSRNDVLIVASVSCIYGLGSPQAYADLSVPLKVGARVERDELLRGLATIQYQRNNLDFKPGTFRVRGDVIEVFPAYRDDRVIRVEMFDDEIERIDEVDSLTGEIRKEHREITIFPASHYITPKERLGRALDSIRVELDLRLLELRRADKLLEAQRLEQRTRYDLEILAATGVCSGIENYSRHLDGRKPGEAPATLINYFPREFLLIVDECHQSIPQIGGMYRGDRARKTTLVEYGFRLPSALDNRPLMFEEYEKLVDRVIYVSATPSRYELERSGGISAEQVIRPTGLIDPEIDVRPARGQVDDLLGEVKKEIAAKRRVLVTTLTKRMAEELTDYFLECGLKVKYMHADVETIERTELVRDLRKGIFDVLVGINLLREGLDIPEVALVAVLDADREGFLRSSTSLIQTCGRAARNVHGRVILYADKLTDSMNKAMGEMARRREKQRAYNVEHGITPRSVEKKIKDILDTIYEQDYVALAGASLTAEGEPTDAAQVRREIDIETKKMRALAQQLKFEEAARVRDRIRELEELELRLR